MSEMDIRTKTLRIAQANAQALVDWNRANIELQRVTSEEVLRIYATLDEIRSTEDRRAAAYAAAERSTVVAAALERTLAALYRMDALKHLSVFDLDGEGNLPAFEMPS